MSSTLYRHGVLHSSADPFAEAVLVSGGIVAWLGADDTAAGLAPDVDEVVDLDGALVAPAFVDAHAHVLETGLALESLDLSAAAGVHSLAGALAAVARAARTARAAGVT
ncbi:MAG TPA: amidohydrolase family protein, partial [Pengzhenrongella sp.]